MQAHLLPKTRKSAIEFYARFLGRAADQGEEHLRRAKRWLCRNDLFYLLAVACSRKDIADSDWLFDRCREVYASPNGHLDLWAREHYKSTIITFGLSLQDILASHGDDPEPRYGGREVTIGIFSHTRPIAKAFLKQIKVEAETNDELNALFPDVLWGVNGKPEATWSEDGGLIFRRKANPKEATVEGWGLVDGQPTSKHFFICVYDDVVTVDSVLTPYQIQRTTDAWAMSLNLGTEGGWSRYIGTRYHAFDTYKTMLDRGSVVPRSQPCTIDGTDRLEVGNLRFRTLPFLLERRRDMGPYIFASQMLLNPTADKAQGFREEWLRYWPATNTRNLNFYILADPASGRKREESQNDFTTFWVLGAAADGNFYITDIIRDRLNLTGRQKALFDLHRKWRPKAVGYEEVGMQADIEHFQYVMGVENYRFEITPISPKGVPKPDRIKRLQPMFEQGRIWLPETCVRLDWENKAVDLVRVFIQEEYLSFPVLAHDDMLDGLTQITEPELFIVLPRSEVKKARTWEDELPASKSSGKQSWQAG